MYGKYKVGKNAKTRIIAQANEPPMVEDGAFTKITIILLCLSLTFMFSGSYYYFNTVEINLEALQIYFQVQRIMLLTLLISETVWYFMIQNVSSLCYLKRLFCQCKHWYFDLALRAFQKMFTFGKMPHIIPYFL